MYFGHLITKQTAVQFGFSGDDLLPILALVKAKMLLGLMLIFDLSLCYGHLH